MKTSVGWRNLSTNLQPVLLRRSLSIIPNPLLSKSFHLERSFTHNDTFLVAEKPKTQLPSFSCQLFPFIRNIVDFIPVHFHWKENTEQYKFTYMTWKLCLHNKVIQIWRELRCSTKTLSIYEIHLGYSLAGCRLTFSSTALLECCHVMNIRSNCGELCTFGHKTASNIDLATVTSINHVTLDSCVIRS